MTSSESRTARCGRRRFPATSLLALATAFAVIAGARRAVADEVAARALFREARGLVAAGDYAAACARFEESLRAEPGIGTTFNLADCWEHLGRTASAWSRFLDVAEAARAAGQRQREEVARGRASALEPKLSRLVIESASREPALVVQRDGVPLGPASWGVPVAVDPGTHVVEAAAPGKKKWAVTVAVTAPSAVVRVEIPPLEDTDAPVSAMKPGAATPDLSSTLATVSHASPAGRSLAPAIVAAAGGLVGLTAAAIFGLQFGSVNNDAKAICPTSMGCTQAEIDQHTSKLSEARRDLTIAYVSAGVGVIATGAAAALWWRATWSGGGARQVARIGPVRFIFERGLAGGLRGIW